MKLLASIILGAVLPALFLLLGYYKGFFIKNPDSILPVWGVAIVLWIMFSVLFHSFFEKSVPKKD
jgi:hypothetical protein